MINDDTTCPDGFPPHLWEGFKLYVIHGIRPGDFLFALLAGDLFGVMNRGDDEAIAGLKPMVVYISNQCPLGSFGTRDNVKEWCLMEGLRGIQEEQG